MGLPGLATLLENYLADDNASASFLVSQIKAAVAESSSQLAKEASQLQKINEWLEEFFEDTRESIDPCSTPENFGSVYHQVCRDVDQVGAHLKAIRSLQPIVDSMRVLLKNLNCDGSPEQALQGYLNARKQLIKAKGAEWAAAAEEKTSRIAQNVSEMLFKNFSSTPVDLLHVLAQSEGDPQSISSFLSEFYSRLLRKTLKGQLEVQKLLSFRTKTRDLLGGFFEERIDKITERMLMQRSEALIALKSEATSEEFAYFVDLAVELGFSSLAKDSQVEHRLCRHMESLRRIKTPRSLFLAFFEEAAMSPQEFTSALIATIPTSKNVCDMLRQGDERPSSAISAEYALCFYRLLRFLIEHHLDLAKDKIPSELFAEVVRVAAAGVLSFSFSHRKVLFAQFAEIEFRWLRLCA